MRLRTILLMLTIVTLLTSCNKDTCESETLSWKNDAHIVLTEFKDVDQEIKNHYDIFKKEEFDSAKLFLRTDDSVKFEKKYRVELPKLKAWFKTKDFGYIAYDKDIISVSYRECNSGELSYIARLYKSPTGIRPTFTKNLVAEIKDSVSLGDNWYFIRTKCNRCGD